MPALSAIKPPRIRRQYLRKYSWLPDVFRIKGSVIARIVGPVLTVTIFSALVVYASTKGYRVALSNNVVPLLSVVVGLILVFRNGTSYDRYWEGRKSFATLTSQIRTLSRQVWINVALPPQSMENNQPVHMKGKSTITSSQLRHRKEEFLRLSVAFVYSVKHYARGEDGLDWDDFQGLIPSWFMRQARSASGSYAATVDNSMDASVIDSFHSRSSSPEAILKTTKVPDATKRVRRKRSKPKVSSRGTISGIQTPLLDGGHQNEYRLDMEEISLPIPLLFAHEMNRMLFEFRRDGFLETVGPAGTNAMSALIQGMVDQLTAIERVANTPIPSSYSIHLKQCVTLYLFALPMTLVRELGWMTVVITTIVAFTFMGIEGIADEIEMPFGTDASDLPLDLYCQDIREEVQYTIQTLSEGGEGMHGYDDGEGDD